MKQTALIIIATITFLGGCKPKVTQTGTDNSKPAIDTIGVDKWKTVYDNFSTSGCFVLYSPADSFIKVYNPQRTNTRFTPASTFKIFNSLVALETGAIKNENEVIKWDGTKRAYEHWNQDLDMKSAFKYSAVWFYRELARRAGKEKMQHWLDTVGYGNNLVVPHIDDFWLEGSLKITSYEQIAFLERLYNNQLPFSQRSMDIVKQIMQVQDVSYTMRAKTGWINHENNKIGWYVGWVEKEGKPYFFVNNMDMLADSLAAARIAISVNILTAEGIIP